ncbi:MAG: hypothetical protein HRT61_12320, partial [Ekhidna sp.]|nr:hypothetical protein [Ekhidna sp.]
MKKLFHLLLFVCSCSFSVAQNLNEIKVKIFEAGVEIDEQVFNGFTAAASIDEVVSLNTSGLSPGIYSFTVTVSDVNGVESIPLSGSFLQEEVIVSNASVTELEYFIGTDPGEGLANSISITSGASITISESLNLSGLSEGFHALHLRGKDETGKWGFYQTQTIFVARTAGSNDVVEVSELEYFINTDPGAGLGTPITITASSNVSLIESLNLSGLSEGFHTVYLRGKLSGGAWGPYTTKNIYVESNVGANDAVVVSELEYFINTDPGAGLGTPITVTASSNVSLIESLNLSGLSEGFHSVYLRGKLSGGAWGPYTTKNIYVESNVGANDAVVVSELEYFVNTDPGAGNGTPVVVAPSSNVSIVENLNLNGLSTGFHTVYLRGKLSGGSWGPYTATTVYVEDNPLGNQVTEIEYFFDTDPGQGNGQTITTSLPADMIDE